MPVRARILQVITDTDRRGAQVFALDLHQVLTQRGYETETVALATGHVGGLDVPVLGPSRRSAATFRRLRQKAREADIVFAHGSTTLPVCAIALFGSGCPFVYRQISDSMFWASTRRRRAQVRVALSRAARVIALWDGAAAVLTEELGVSPSRIKIVPNGVNAAEFPVPSEEQRIAARARLGLVGDGFVVCYAGALVAEKGVEVAICATSRLSGEVSLLVAGDGPQRQTLEREAVSRLGTQVKFLGSVDPLLDVYWASDVLVFPSRGGDSMPAVVIEAGLSGLPVIATPVAAIPQMVVEGETGYLVAVDDVGAVASRLSELQRDPAHRAALGAAARSRCLDRYTMDPVADGWIRVIEQMMH